MNIMINKDGMITTWTNYKHSKEPVAGWREHELYVIYTQRNIYCN